jgi:hypothetical protein
MSGWEKSIVSPRLDDNRFDDAYIIRRLSDPRVVLLVVADLRATLDKADPKVGRGQGASDGPTAVIIREGIDYQVYSGFLQYVCPQKSCHHH